MGESCKLPRPQKLRCFGSCFGLKKPELHTITSVDTKTRAKIQLPGIKIHCFNNFRRGGGAGSAAGHRLVGGVGPIRQIDDVDLPVRFTNSVMLFSFSHILSLGTTEIPSGLGLSGSS